MTLQEIQQRQFDNPKLAEQMLRELIGNLFPLDIRDVSLRPLAVSLNSFNGFLTLGDGTRLFFKSHTEADNVIGEYYNASVLAEAGYPVIQPLYASTEAGRQILLYELIEDSSVFDVAWSVEIGQGHGFDALAQAQVRADQDLYECYVRTLADQDSASSAIAPIHQLFYHRLRGGRLERFYAPDKRIALPDGAYTMDRIRRARWIINGRHYTQTLDDLIARAGQLLDPQIAGPSIIGHGDAHNGNVFWRDEGLVYFDPAFAGRHHPLLDLTKPLFHNVFAMWMYFPAEKANTLRLDARVTGEVIEVDYTYELHPVRRMFLESKVDHVLKPTVRLLHERGLLDVRWRQYLKVALMCCPLLTMNLADPSRFPPSIAALGLAQTIEMGGTSPDAPSEIDMILDQAASAI
jgi:hypothetical protein